MSEDKTPQRPDGLNQDASSYSASTPRVEVEPTPVPPAAAGQTPQTPQGQAGQTAGANPTTQIPSGSAAPTQGYGTYQQPTQAQPTPAAAPQETVTRTVVKTKTKKLPVFLTAFGGLVVGAVLVIALVMSGAFRITDTNVEATDSGSSSTQTIEIDAEDTTLSEAVAAKALPSVVSITAQNDSSSAMSQGSTSSSSSSGSLGSGVILDTDGNILTNYHVVGGYSSIVVTLDDGSTYEAELVGSDESSDLAVIKLTDADSASLTPIEVGDSDDINVGEWVMAIGSPFGNEQSVSTGIVSALYRSTAMTSTSGTTIYANMIQTDAAINPGNSGGALVNDNGELIGINSIIESYSGSSSGVGFAIPSNYAVKIANQIIAGETPEHPYLGVSVATVNAYNARQNNLATDSGAYISNVVEGGPAQEAGLEQGDIVTAINGDEVTSADGLIIALRGYEVGDTVTLTVMRGSDEQEIEVELGSDASNQTEDQGDASSNGSSGNSMTEEQLRQYLEEMLGQR